MYKIMLTDDEGIVIDSLSFILKKEFGEECLIESARTGRDGIELAERFRPDIAIMDIQMPGINGIDAMKEIREENSKMILVVMSAIDQVDYAKEAIHLGVFDYLNKPIDRKRIVEVIKRAMYRIEKERMHHEQSLIIREKMEKVVPVVESSLISHIIAKDGLEEEIEYDKNLLEIKQQYGYMMVLVFGEMSDAHSVAAFENHLQQVREIIKSFFPAVIGSVMMNQIPVLVLEDSLSTDSAKHLAQLEHAREMIRNIRRQLNQSVRAGVGSVCRIENAAESYAQALQSLSHSTGMVIHIDDFQGEGKEENRCSDYMNEMRRKILELVLWAENFSDSRELNTYHFLDRKEYMMSLLTMKDYEELRQWFLDKMLEVCTPKASFQDRKPDGMIEKTKRYIHKYYTKELSLEDVAKEVEISSSYLSKRFKEETGKKFIDYLTEVRLDKAQKLLAEGNLSIKEIGISVGYSDPNYFSRIFKKNVGTTPTQYREHQEK